MERELKFRAWDKKLKQYIITGFYILGETTAFNLIEQYYIDNNIEFEHGLEFLQYVELEQFTGLKDKNGIDIYEGDIIKRENQIIIVLWNNKYAGFTLHCDNWSCLGFFYEDLDVDKVEVIGNIYDNPELLNN